MKKLKFDCCGEGSEKKFVKAYFCPNCKSFDVGYIFGLTNLWGIVPRMRCRKCNYVSGIFPQMVINQEKLNKQNRKINSKIANNCKKCKGGRK